LGQFVERGGAQESPDARKAEISDGRLSWAKLLVGIGHHGAKLQYRKRFPPAPYPLIVKEHWPAIVTLNHGRDESPHRQ
jgi:hypothetical protein